METIRVKISDHYEERVNREMNQVDNQRRARFCGFVEQPIAKSSANCETSKGVPSTGQLNQKHRTQLETNKDYQISRNNQVSRQLTLT